MKLEKDLSELLKESIKSYEIFGNICWSLRINSGSIYIPGKGRINLAPAGTPDFLCLVRDRFENILVLFVEIKSDSGFKKFETSKEEREVRQRDFRDKYNRKPGFKVLIIKEIKEFNDFIDKYSKDFVSFLPKEL